jgi:2-phosphoglycerate kinase
VFRSLSNANVNPTRAVIQFKGRNVLVEGVAVLPELVNQLKNIDRRVVFTGNQGNEYKENIKKRAETNRRDWMRSSSDQYIGAFATFVVRMSAYIEEEARIFGFQYIEMDERPFRDAADVIVEMPGLGA